MQMLSNSNAVMRGSLMNSELGGRLRPITPCNAFLHTVLLFRDINVERSSLEVRARWSRSSGWRCAATYVNEERKFVSLSRESTGGSRLNERASSHSHLKENIQRHAKQHGEII